MKIHATSWKTRFWQAWVLAVALIGRVESHEPFCWAQLSDPQIGMTSISADRTSFFQAVKQVNLLAPAFAIVCGDLVHRPDDVSFASFNAVRATCRVRLYAVPGERDVTLKLRNDAMEQYRSLIGSETFSFTHNGFRFIGIHSDLFKMPIPVETDNHLAWIEKELLQTRWDACKPVIVSHHPLFVEMLDEPESWLNIPTAYRSQLWGLYRQYRVQAVLSGHLRRYAGLRLQDILMVTAESVTANMDQSPTGFRLWFSDGSRLTGCRFIPLYHRMLPENPDTPVTDIISKENDETCIANLRFLDAVKEWSGMLQGLSNHAEISLEPLREHVAGDIGQITCPDGGIYTLNPLGSDPACSLPGHVLPSVYTAQEPERRAVMQPMYRNRLLPAGLPVLESNTRPEAGAQSRNALD